MQKYAFVCLTLFCLTLISCSNASPSTTLKSHYSLTYVAIGASDAYGIGTQEPIEQSWPTLVASTLGSDVHLVNLGIPGETVADALTSEVPIAEDAAPDVITVWLGVNDLEAQVALGTYRAQLLQLLTALKQGTHATIFVGNLPDLTLLPFFAGGEQDALRQVVQSWNDVIAEVVAATGAHLIDLFAQWADLAQHPSYISRDGLHPSVSGARRLAAIFAAAMQDAGVR